MNQSQKAILWIGIIVVTVFLFGDASFRQSLFGKNNVKTTAATNTTSQTGANLYALAQLLGQSSGIPASSPNTGTTPTGTTLVAT
jgi:flagellar basal body-associated protein FliL